MNTTQKQSGRTGGWATRGWAALAGIVSGGLLLGVAELAAAFIAPAAGPLLAVGSFVIDIVPRWAKELAIQLFGSSDKLFLLGSLGLAAVVVAAVAGLLELRRPLAGRVVFGLLAVTAAAAAATRSGLGLVGAVPALLGGVVAVIAVGLLVGRLRRWRSGAASDAVATVDRRRFLLLTAAGAVLAVAGGVGGRIVSAATSSIASVRKALRLPAPAQRVTVPSGAELEVPGLTPLFTPNADFYRVDTALSIPAVDPANWRLRVGGLVEREVDLGFDDLLRLGVDEYAITLTCVSNEVGGSLTGTARWLGVPVRSVLALARPRRSADMVLSRSVDGFTASTPLEALTDAGRDAILAVGMNGEPLPLEHGFPVRMVVPGLYGYVSATKWLSELTVTTFAADQGYWTSRGYSAKAPIKLSSRIDTPRVDKPVAAGRTTVAGVAWAQTVGIGKVEVRIDGGDWQQARLSTPVNRDTWVQWALDWEARPGTHTLSVRATDRDGRLQEEKRAPIAPNGSTGWHSTLVRVE
ncbi:molybdopterin-dependent oxidoreductase [Leifsonia sp. F6_8S_P_1B]|uniref:Molybdopterin-dependent oxidoreductase n=1 Tax=Leifsonia williamsii TaxID=3035919 RepID=A0ABT8KCT4_9MICO|nr:molybdopterin-dependent oxidoreductase [Leifsonia williamsii]MDN4615274.1 molybdopterin-dependent oxidoreductase [Leifsonia williamsii]